MKKIKCLILITLLPLAACGTVSNGYHGIGHTVGGLFEDTNTTPCPPVTIDPSLKTLSQYSDPHHKDDAHLISSVRMDAVARTCTINKNNIAVAMTITMKGTLGPKGRETPGGKPAFSYPYIVAVLDQSGQPVVEQVYATTFAYGAHDTMLDRTEHIRQIIPLNDRKAAPYTLAIGFEMPAARNTPPGQNPSTGTSQ